MDWPTSPFTVAFDLRDENEVLTRWRDLLRSNRWSEGDAVAAFEHAWSAWNDAEAVAFSAWTGGALGILDYVGVVGETVLCPSNTFLATPRAVIERGGKVAFYDCNREDLCGSYLDFVRKAEAHRPKAAWIVHIGGHIAFDIDRIADYCRSRGIVLIEDCAHAQGASWWGRRPGTWGLAGVYSFYATKTAPSGEGGVVVTRDPQLATFLRAYRNYGKGSGGRFIGMNYRMHEFTAVLAEVQTRRMPEIVAWKTEYVERVLKPHYPNHLRLPEGMQSGYYKFIVFEPAEASSGRVYERPCHRIFGEDNYLPNSDWVAANHSCPPVYYPRELAFANQPASRSAERP